MKNFEKEKKIVWLFQVIFCSLLLPSSLILEEQFPTEPQKKEHMGKSNKRREDWLQVACGHAEKQDLGWIPSCVGFSPNTEECSIQKQWFEVWVWLQVPLVAECMIFSKQFNFSESHLFSCVSGNWDDTCPLGCLHYSVENKVCKCPFQLFF